MEEYLVLEEEAAVPYEGSMALLEQPQFLVSFYCEQVHWLPS